MWRMINYWWCILCCWQTYSQFCPCLLVRPFLPLSLGHPVFADLLYVVPLKEVRIIIIIIIWSFHSALLGEISDPFVLIWGLVLFDGMAVLLCSVNASELASSRTTWMFPRRCESALTDPRCVYSVFIKGWQRETKAKRLAAADGDEWNHGGVGLVNPPIFISSHMTARVHPTT